MKLHHQSFVRALAIAGLSISIATAQNTNTSGTTATPGTDRTQSGSQSSSSTTGSGAQSGSQSRQQSGHVAGAAGNSESGNQDMVGKNDKMFMTKAAQSGMMEVHLAQMAQQKAASDDVKAYARKLEQDHSKANDQLKKIADERGVQLPSDMGQHQQQMAKFQNLSGEEFDRAYMKMQVQHHKKDLSEFRKHQNRSMDTDLKEFASAQVPVLQQHYEQAQQLAASTGTRSRTADKNSSSNSQTGGSATSGSNQEQGSKK